MMGKWIFELLILSIISLGLVLGCLEEFLIQTDNVIFTDQKPPNNESEIISLTIRCCLISSIYKYNYTFGHLNVPQTLVITHMKISQIPVLPKLTGITEVQLMELQDNVVSAGAFKNLPKLKKINITRSRMTKIPNIKFGGVGTLENLILSYNEIEEIDEILDAEEIHLDHNRIRMINVPFENVKSIYLSYNSLKTITNSYFQHPENLEKLYLTYNNISEIFFGSFWNMLNLEDLHLDQNKITALDDDGFYYLKKLKILNLSHNKIENLELGLFDNLINLEYLDIGYNLIKVLHEELLNPLVNLNKFYLNNNRIDWWEIREIKMHNPNLTEVNLMWNNWICGDLEFILEHLEKQNITVDKYSGAFVGSSVQGVPCIDQNVQASTCNTENILYLK